MAYTYTLQPASSRGHAAAAAVVIMVVGFGHEENRGVAVASVGYHKTSRPAFAAGY
jgi:hypothetical protein